jgi:hypothetical protein
MRRTCRPWHTLWFRLKSVWHHLRAWEQFLFDNGSWFLHVTNTFPQNVRLLAALPQCSPVQRQENYGHVSSVFNGQFSQQPHAATDKVRLWTTHWLNRPKLMLTRSVQWKNLGINKRQNKRHGTFHDYHEVKFSRCSEHRIAWCKQSLASSRIQKLQLYVRVSKLPSGVFLIAANVAIDDVVQPSLHPFSWGRLLNIHKLLPLVISIPVAPEFDCSIDSNAV